jgi:hypothetical protein
MRRFYLQRDEDVSNVSGTGVVAEGIEWDDGKVCLRWRGKHRSMVLWDDIASVEVIHGHDGRTRVVWVDGEEVVDRVDDELSQFA